VKREQVQRWRHEPISFIEECLHDPETGAPFRLYPDIRLVRLATATVLSSSHVPGWPEDSLKRGPTINGRAV
jgi:hypothetical protein